MICRRNQQQLSCPEQIDAIVLPGERNQLDCLVTHYIHRHVVENLDFSILPVPYTAAIRYPDAASAILTNRADVFKTTRGNFHILFKSIAVCREEPVLSSCPDDPALVLEQSSAI
jgi:hypothetical protein